MSAFLLGSGISMEFDFFRYVSIFLTYFGHNLGTVPKSLVCRDEMKVVTLMADDQEVGRIIDPQQVRFITQIALVTAEGAGGLFLRTYDVEREGRS